MRVPRRSLLSRTSKGAERIPIAHTRRVACGRPRGLTLWAPALAFLCHPHGVGKEAPEPAAKLGFRITDLLGQFAGGALHLTQRRMSQWMTGQGHGRQVHDCGPLSRL